MQADAEALWDEVGTVLSGVGDPCRPEDLPGTRALVGHERGDPFPLAGRTRLDRQVTVDGSCLLLRHVFLGED
ncbi:MAG: hypothetical protein JWN65_2730 [Solirubrobacterales bacterium]|nr:hypothetical protein [Solirubrobacterales bacterium]